MKTIYACMVLLPLAFTASAQQGATPIPDPVEPPPRIESGEAIEPEVTIIRRENEVLEEYRINGQLYMVKVTPIEGVSYYLLDDDGDGHMETKMNAIHSDPVVPQWVLFRW